MPTHQAVPAAPRADKARFQKILAVKSYRPGHRTVLYGRAGAPDSQILCPLRPNFPRLATLPPLHRRRRAHTRTRTRAPARRAVARRRQHAAARHRVRSRHGEPYDDEQLELARVERVGRALWPEKSRRRTAARRRPSRPTWRHSPRRAAACAMSPRHLIDRGGADALGVRVRRRADRRRDIAQRARVRRRSTSCRRRPTDAYGSVIRPVMTLCAARRPLSMRSAGCGEPRGTTQSIANRLSAEKKRLAGSRGAGVPFCGCVLVGGSPSTPYRRRAPRSRVERQANAW